ncbi:IS5/IS1182 family transposase, partial [Lactobacillus sp. UMNPBX9]
RGQKPVENDIGLVLMSMNLVKLGKMIAQFSTKYIENIKIRLQILSYSKLWSRIIFLETGNH